MDLNGVVRPQAKNVVGERRGFGRQVERLRKWTNFGEPEQEARELRIVGSDLDVSRPELGAVAGLRVGLHDLHIAARPRAPAAPAAGRTEERIAQPAEGAEIEKLLEADALADRPLALPSESVR